MRNRPHELRRRFGEKLAERLAGMMPGGNAALITRKPDFAYWLVAGSNVKPWAKIAIAPDARIKVGLNEEWGEVS